MNSPIHMYIALCSPWPPWKGFFGHAVGHSPANPLYPLLCHTPEIQCLGPGVSLTKQILSSNPDLRCNFNQERAEKELVLWCQRGAISHFGF